MQDVSKQIEKTLLLYKKDIQEKLNKQTEESMKELVELTKATAPVGKRKRHYKSKITSKPITRLGNVSQLWYVKAPDYRLSHLLENGHHSRNGGWVNGTGFISKANDKVQKDYEKKVEEIIRD